MKLQAYSIFAACLACSAWSLRAQTAVDLTRQGKVESGAQLPAQCVQGQLFIQTGGSAGPALYVCAQSNVWTAPGNLTPGAGISIAAGSITADDAVVPDYYTGSGAPSITCLAGRDFYVDVTAGTLYYCKTSGQWQAVSPVGHTHSAADIVSGTLSAARLPGPTSSTLGGLKTVDCSGGGQFLQKLNTDGSGTCATPSGGGNVNGPGSSTDGYIPLWNGTSGTLLKAGIPTSAILTTVPAPSTSTLGGLYSAGAASHKWVTNIDATGTQQQAQPACGDLSNSAASCSTDTTNAANISSGTLSAARLPGPTSSTLGGLKTVDCSGGGQFLQKLNTDGSGTCATPSGGGNVNGPGSSTDGYIPLWNGTSGTLLKAGIPTSAILTTVPAPSASALGGLYSAGAASHKWVTNIDATGTQQQAQPACGDLSNSAASCYTDTTNAANISTGTLNSARLPAPTATTLGGVEALSCGSGYHVKSINTDGSVTCSADSGGSGGSPTAGAGISVSGSTVSSNPLDTSMDYLYENFDPVGVGYQSNNIGLLRWSWVGSNGTTPICTGTNFTHCGLWQWSTGSTAGTLSYMTEWAAGNAAGFKPIGGKWFGATNWGYKWIFETPALSTQVKVRIGWSYNQENADTSNYGPWLRYSNSTGCATNDSDTGWVAYASDGTNTVSGSLGTFATSTWYTLYAYSTSVGSIVFSLTPDGGSTSTVTLNASAGSPGTVNVLQGVPVVQLVSCDTNAKTIVVDEFRWLQTGIAR